MNEVTRKKKNEVSTNVVDFTNPEFAGAGLENVGSGELAIPFLKIASAQSPEMKKNNPKFIEGMQQGNIFNSVTRDYYDSIKVIPCFFRVRGIEWMPLGEGTGAPVKIWKPEEIPPLERGIDGEDHYMIDGKPSESYIERTAEYFVLMVKEDGSLEKATITMKKTQFKKSRYWNTTMANQKIESKDGKMLTLPSFANVYTMQGVQEANSKNDWWGWKIDLFKSVNDFPKADYYVQEAMNFMTLVKSGDIDPAPEVKDGDKETVINPPQDDIVLGSS